MTDSAARSGSKVESLARTVDDIIGKAHHLSLKVVERGRIGPVADCRDQRIAHAQTATDRIMLLDLIFRPAEQPDPDDGDFAQHGVELAMHQ